LSRPVATRGTAPPARRATPGSEAGIAATLRGGLHDAYPGTSGLGAIDVLVSEQDLPRANDVISRADTVGLEFDPPDDEG
jgi:hypothetical protein